MEAVASKLGISRSTISRLIASARDEGLVRISFHVPEEPRDSLPRRIEDLYSVDVTAVQVPGTATEVRRLERMAGVAGSLIDGAIEDKMMVGIAWGTTVSTISERLMPKHMFGVVIIQLNGVADPTMTGLPYVDEMLGNFTRIFGAKVFPFPVPAFFNYTKTRDLIWRERSVQVARDIGRNADVTVSDIGSFTSPLPSHVYAGGCLSPEKVTKLRHNGVVDDVCTVPLHADGTYGDIEINTRAAGPTPAELARIPRKICAVAGTAKAPALAAALRSGAMTDLVIDNECAAALLKVEKGDRAESDCGAWSRQLDFESGSMLKLLHGSESGSAPGPIRSRAWLAPNSGAAGFQIRSGAGPDSILNPADLRFRRGSRTLREARRFVRGLSTG